MEEEGVDVRRLLRADGEVECLERKNPTPKQVFGYCKHFRCEGHLPHAALDLPGIHHAVPVIPLKEVWMPRVDDPLPNHFRARVEGVVVKGLAIADDLVEELGRTWIVEHQESIAGENRP